MADVAATGFFSPTHHPPQAGAAMGYRYIKWSGVGDLALRRDEWRTAGCVYDAPVLGVRHVRSPIGPASGSSFDETWVLV